jgi:hypothetical protein
MKEVYCTTEASVKAAEERLPWPENGFKIAMSLLFSEET